MNAALWILASLLGALFLVAGAMKVVQPKEALADRGLTWVESFPPSTVKTIGALEVLAAIGLVVPPLVDVAPVLAPAAAAGIMLMMVGAAITHMLRNEAPLMGVNAVVLLLAAVIVWGRLGPYTF